MATEDADRYVSINASITESQRDAVRRMAKERQVPTSVVVRDALRAFLGADASGRSDQQPVASSA